MDKILKSFLIICLINFSKSTDAKSSATLGVSYLSNNTNSHFSDISFVLKESNFCIPINQTYIQNIKSEPPDSVPHINKNRLNPFRYKKQIEISFAKGSYNRSFTSLRFINGFIYNKSFIGVGVGTTLHHTYYGGLVYYSYRSYPIFLRYSYSIYSKKSTPYLFCDIGSQLHNKDEKELKPLFYRIGLGNKFVIKKSIFYSSIDYTYNKARFKYDYQSQIGYSYWYRNHMAAICVGWQFN